METITVDELEFRHYRAAPGSTGPTGHRDWCHAWGKARGERGASLVNRLMDIAEGPRSGRKVLLTRAGGRLACVGEIAQIDTRYDYPESGMEITVSVHVIGGYVEMETPQLSPESTPEHLALVCKLSEL